MPAPDDPRPGRGEKFYLEFTMSIDPTAVDFSKPLMPKATAMWLIDNTTLTFDQIAIFCGLHEIEVQALADAEVGRGIVSRNPIDNNELTVEDIKRCEADGDARLKIIRQDLPQPKLRGKGPRYTPVSKRSDKPDAIAWLIKHHPELSDAAICKLVGTTKTTLNAIRDRTHVNSSTLKPRHPAELGLCTYQDLERVSYKALRAMGRDPEAEAAARQQKLAEETNDNEEEAKSKKSTFDFSNFFKSNK
jgi:uncharacterized protein